jgi:uncharacterized repeat protein (TIGR03847 family)
VARRIYSFASPDRFICGTVGVPGQRTFFLQAREGARLVSVALEKVQVAVLAERMQAVIDAVAVGQGEASAPERPAPGQVPEMLDEPLQEAFRVGTLALAWDVSEEVLVVEARAQTDEGDEELDVDDDDPAGPDVVRVRLTPDDVRAFVRAAVASMEAGRPPCPLCGQPLDPQGHLCPRRNGFVN